MKPPPLDDSDDPETGSPKSGKKPKWVNALTDWSADEMRMSYAQVKEHGDAKGCDVLRGCDGGVRWAVKVHDCAFYAACDDHAALLASELMSAIAQLGFFVCSDCGRIFFMQAAAVRFWRI